MTFDEWAIGRNFSARDMAVAAAAFEAGQFFEREACAKIASKYHIPMTDSVADAIANEILARDDE